VAARTAAIDMLYIYIYIYLSACTSAPIGGRPWNLVVILFVHRWHCVDIWLRFPVNIRCHVVKRKTICYYVGGWLRQRPPTTMLATQCIRSSGSYCWLGVCVCVCVGSAGMAMEFQCAATCHSSLLSLPASHHHLTIALIHTFNIVPSCRHPLHYSEYVTYNNSCLSTWITLHVRHTINTSYYTLLNNNERWQNHVCWNKNK